MGEGDGGFKQFSVGGFADQPDSIEPVLDVTGKLIAWKLHFPSTGSTVGDAFCYTGSGALIAALLFGSA